MAQPQSPARRPRRLLDYPRLISVASAFRARAGLDAPPYSSRKIIIANLPSITVTGGLLPAGVLEMSTVGEDGHSRIVYNRRVNHLAQRVAIVHGLAHLLFDLPEDGGRRCGRTYEDMEIDRIERRADLFAGELLVPLTDLDGHFDDGLFPQDSSRGDWDDYVDHVASTFKVPGGFLRWRLYDLAKLRASHWAV